jgi:hypothetical protein
MLELPKRELFGAYANEASVSSNAASSSGAPDLSFISMDLIPVYRYSPSGKLLVVEQLAKSPNNKQINM